MRLDGEISDIDEERESEAKTLACSIGVGFPLLRNLVVGYALTSKKKKSFLQPKLVCLARNKGIVFVAIDRNRPLADQGPFDIVLHKLLGKDWCQIIEDYRLNHPEVTILDPPYAIQHVHNRQSMLENVVDLTFPDCYGKVSIPKQVVVTDDPLSICDEVAKAGLKLPLVAKPLLVDGSAKSHELFIAYDAYSLSKLEPPLVVQEFINHGGVLFKVYIIGETIKVVRRFSLPDVCYPELSKAAGVFSFPRVSCAAASADDANLDPDVGVALALEKFMPQLCYTVPTNNFKENWARSFAQGYCSCNLRQELPPTPLLERLSKELRHRLGLRLFNIDIIREHGTKDLFYVIDINYFPGFGKMPDYEHIFTDFLLNLKHSQGKKKAAS